MNISLLDLYPLLSVAWAALLVVLAIWGRREPGRRTLRGIASLLGVAAICVMIRALFETRPFAPGADNSSLRLWGWTVGIALTLIVPAGFVGASSFQWALRRGARWGIAYGTAAAIAILTSLIALAIGFVVVAGSAS